MNDMKQKLAFIGAGNMAEALIQGLIASRTFLPEDISFTEVRENRAEYIRSKCHIRSHDSNVEAVQASDIILFAVKPQNINDVLDEIAKACHSERSEESHAIPSLSNKLFITIAAGVPIRRFEEKLGPGSRVIRVMPNMGALIGKSASGISRGSNASTDDEKLCQEIMAAVGEVVPVKEELLDAVTAVSGSGPAYFFYFIEALRESGIALGLEPGVCEKLVYQTAVGAAQLVLETRELPETLRKKVTSPGGTTEAAIKVFDEHKLKRTIIKAVQHACERSKELSR